MFKLNTNLHLVVLGGFGRCFYSLISLLYGSIAAPLWGLLGVFPL